MAGALEGAKNEPVVLATLVAPVLVYVAATFGFDLDEGIAATVAGLVLAAGSILARNLVRTRRTLPDPDATRPAETTIRRPPDRG